MRIWLALLIPALAGVGALRADGGRRIALLSPDGRLRVDLKLPEPGSGADPFWTSSYRGKPLLAACRLSLTPDGEPDMLAGARMVSTRSRAADERVPVLFGKCDAARDRYREIRCRLESPRGRLVEAVFRCYDDAVALRYEIPKQPGLERLTLAEEGTSFTPEGNPTAFVQYLENYRTSHEHHVTRAPLRDVRPDTLLDLPLTWQTADGTYAAITEAALRRYAGMSLMRVRTAGAAENGAPGTELTCRLTPRGDGDARAVKVIRDLPAETPWRVVMVGDRPGALLESSVLYCLNAPPVIGDTSWIKPGKTTFSWWNGNLVGPKPAEPILSLAANQKYIDFCARSGIAFHAVIADEDVTPWYFQSRKGVVPGPDTDVTRLRADLDLPAIRRYAEARGVRLWTWVHQAALKGRVEEAFAAFERFGWSGMMVDFFDHDDQESVEHAEAILAAAARHHILIHLHGVWKPTGLQRTYPNLMNHEGALNLEYLKWSKECTPQHTLMLAFTRLIAGPMDYHLGGFRAVTSDAFAPHNIGPNVLGTRAQQLAMYVCFDNPNPMVADYPEAYLNQPGFEFIQDVPTYWDETRVLQGDIGETLVTARRKGTHWYLGGLHAGPARSVEAPLAFLGGGNYRERVWRDVLESAQDPNRIGRTARDVTRRDHLRVQVSADGGFVAHLFPIADSLDR